MKHFSAMLVPLGAVMSLAAAAHAGCLDLVSRVADGPAVAVADGTAGVQLLRACSSADLVPAPRTGVSGRVRPGSSAP